MILTINHFFLYHQNSAPNPLFGLPGPIGFLFWAGLFMALLLSAGVGWYLGSKKAPFTDPLEDQRDLTFKKEKDVNELNRSINNLNHEKEEISRQNRFLKEKNESLQGHLFTLEKKMVQQNQQFQRIQNEMETQLVARSQIERDLLNSQTRLELINSLSSGLFSNSSFTRILYQSVLKTQKIFPKIQVYYGAISNELILTWQEFDSSKETMELDLRKATYYLNLLKKGDPIDCRNISLVDNFRPLMNYFQARSIISFLELPLHSETILTGTLGFGTTSPHEWTDHETSTLKELSRFLSVAKKTTELENERAKAVRKLLAAKKTAEDATKAKSVFLSTLSHEIRTPLNGVIGMTQLIMNTKLDSEQEEFASIANSSGKVLLALLNDILDFSKIEAGKLELESVRFNLRETIEKACELLAFEAQSKGLEIICNLPSHLPEFVKGDSTRLRQVLINLVTNAVKFTEKGKVVIKVLVLDQTNEKVHLQFDISDTGIGISEKNLKRLFRSFSQADSSTTRKFGGTGLGLNISKQLIELMNGNISVTSSEGRGSVFSFQVELKDPEQSSPATGTSQDSLVVVIASDPDLRETLTNYVIKAGHIPFTEIDLPLNEGFWIPIFQSHKTILTSIWDLKDWLDTPEIEKKNLETVPSTSKPILLVPLNSKFKNKETPFEILKKPIQWKTFCNALVPENYQVNASLFFQSSPLEKQKGHILLVEDHSINRKLCGTFLKKGGYTFVEANNGLEALAALEKEHFNAILMDCRMPQMDGFETTKRIRLNKKYENLPIVALTANAMKSERDRCLKSGMDAFLTKPLSIEALFETLTDLIGNRKGDLEDSMDMVPSNPERDFSFLQEAAGGDKDLFNELIQLFFDDVKDAIKNSEKPFQEKNFTFLGELAHGIKGASANSGVSDLEKAALELEALCQSPFIEQKPDQVDKAYHHLLATFQKVELDIHNQLGI